MRKKLFSTAVTVITIIALGTSTGFNSLAKTPAYDNQENRSVRPAGEDLYDDHSIPDSRDLISIGPIDSSGTDTSSMECPPNHEEEEAKRIKMEEGGIADSVNQGSTGKYSIIEGDEVITFDSFGIGIIPDSMAAKECDIFYWRDGNGDVWRFNSTPDGPLLDDDGFHPELYYKYHGKYNNITTWQEYFGAKKIGEAKPTIGIPETAK